MQTLLEEILEIHHPNSCTCHSCQKKQFELEEELRPRRKPRISNRRKIRPGRKRPFRASVKKRLFKRRRPKSPLKKKKKYRRRKPFVFRKKRFKKLLTKRHPILQPGYHKAIRLNHKYARVLGWKKYQRRILTLLELPSITLIGRRFVKAVARWQRRKGLRSTGVIRIKTWRLMRRILGIKFAKSSILASIEKTFFKNNPKLKKIPLAPSKPLAEKSGTAGKIAKIYNRQGNLMKELAQKTNIELAAAIAVWLVESRGPKLRLGEPQTLKDQYANMGYSSSRAMHTAFQNSIRAQVLGFFDYCMHSKAPEAGDLLVYLRNKNWQNFARYYNPDRNVADIKSKLQRAYNKSKAILNTITEDSEFSFIFGEI